MKKNVKITATTAIVLFTGLVFLTSCSNNDETDQIINNTELTQADKDALLFMLEEEKLARDTYDYLDDLWSINQFGNIKNSEESHLNAVANLLTQNNISFEILPYGEFANTEIQTLYNQFIIDGGMNVNNALKIGATIEDLDIRDLQEYMDISSNIELISVFKRLQCGSRNHLRSFTAAIENLDDSYNPQYITPEAYDVIINSDNEQCN